LLPISAVIFDVDGVLLDSPHEVAWRQALAGFAEPARLTPSLYQSVVAGKPRLDGARAVLAALGVPASRAEEYAAAKQVVLSAMIAVGQFTVFADGIDFLLALRGHGLKIAAASSSKNANRMLAQIALPGGGTLLDAFDANLCGHDVQHGKPDPEIFLLAAHALGIEPARCLVVEDAGVGIAAGRAAGMRTLGIARHGDTAMLTAAQAELVVTNLSQVDVAHLGEARLVARHI